MGLNFIHQFFDLAATLLAIAGGILAYKWKLKVFVVKTASSISPGYFICLTAGSLIGSYVLGTLNMIISDHGGIGRSILGTLAGAIITVEIYKYARGLTGSTGYMYVIPFCLCVIIGRIGCFFAGLEDYTYGKPTQVAWGHDFGDGILRHPVQMYESLAMLSFLIAACVLLWLKAEIFARYGFYICVCFYALQRFIWENFKPYDDLAANLNLFQLTCLGLILYSLVMIKKTRYDYRSA